MDAVCREDETGKCISILMSYTVDHRELPYDFIADKVIVYTAGKRRLSQTRAH
jgi:hypothetical protein